MEDVLDLLKRADRDMQPETWGVDEMRVGSTTPGEDHFWPVADCFSELDACHIAAVRNALPAVIAKLQERDALAAEVERLREIVAKLPVTADRTDRIRRAIESDDGTSVSARNPQENQ